jgi:hypothetical protein
MTKKRPSYESRVFDGRIIHFRNRSTSELAKIAPDEGGRPGPCHRRRSNPLQGRHKARTLQDRSCT